MNIQTIHNVWNIKPEHISGNSFTGYEPVLDELSSFTVERYNNDPEGTIQRVMEIYRSINLVPIVYFTEQGLIDEIRKFKRRSYNPVKLNTIGLGNNQGQTINRFLFPNMMTAEPKGRGSNSLKDRFHDDTKLARAIRICFEFRDGDKLVYPTAIRRALELVTGENIQNFKPQNARALVERLCPVLFGRVYDYSSGYGGRLLGITSSNMNYEYVGIDPNTETFEYLTYLNELIVEATGNGGNLHCDVSESFEPEEIDLAFSSPPYFLTWRNIVMKKHSVWYVIAPLTNGLVDMLSLLLKTFIRVLTRMEFLLQTLRITKPMAKKNRSKSSMTGSRYLME